MTTTQQMAPAAIDSDAATIHTMAFIFIFIFYFLQYTYTTVTQVYRQKKSTTFPGPPGRIFQNLFGARECLYIKKKRHLLTIFKGGKICRHCTLYLSKQESTQTGCYTIAACFPFEPPEKCMINNDIFPKLSRTLSFNFQDFPGPK